MPLLGWFLSRRGPTWLDSTRRTQLTALGGCAYLGLMLFTVWQALRGQSIVQPDLLSMGVALGLSAAIGLVTALLVFGPAPRSSALIQER